MCRNGEVKEMFMFSIPKVDANRRGGFMKRERRRQNKQAKLKEQK